MNPITRNTKLKIFKVLKDETQAINLLFQQDQLLDFLEEIWNLRDMPSTDPRFEDAYGDIIQHTIRNDDWDVNFLFLERLELLKNEEKFALFIENIISPKYRENEDDIFLYVQYITPHLEQEDLTLRIKNYTNAGLPIYTIQELDKEFDLPNDIKQNEIVFFVGEHHYGNLTTKDIPEESKLPCFVLVYNSGWNDFGYQTSFRLYFLPKPGDVFELGAVKIMSDFEDSIINVLPDTFTNLDEHFCSLGQHIDYYIKLKESFGKDFLGIIYALKDAAFLEKVYDKFERDHIFNKSLIRWDEAERLLREAKFKIHNFKIEDLYNFKYLFKPKYSSQAVEINFDFDVTKKFPSRINALIGKNGTGKTQLITTLPVDISKKDEQKFLPKTPLFSKLIAVSYSVFDRFEIPRRNAEFNYVYCGLRKEDGENYSDRGLINRFHATWKIISQLNRMGKWKKILTNFIEEELLSEFIVSRESDYTVNIEGFHRVRPMLSSGQSIILYILSEIIANIRYDSLLLYDEPETHLHPNAITQLVNTIYELVNEFESYCILATHSPLIIRELPSKNVFVIERQGNSASIRRIGIESFGENLATLTEEVFGNKSVSKQYKKIIDELVGEFNSFEEIVSLIESDGLPLSLNARLYIKSLLRSK